MKLGLGLGINKMRGRPPRKPEGEPLALRSAPTPEPEAQAMSAAAPAPNEPPKRKGLIYRIWQRIKATVKPCPFKLCDSVRHLYQQQQIKYGRGTKPGRRKEVREDQCKD